MNNEQFLFVDTAGFGAADLDDKGNLGDIEACLTALGPFTTLVGIMFVYGCPERLHLHDLRTIHWLQCFCGPDFYSNITVVTTKWDIFKQDEFEKRWATVKELEAVLSPILCPETRQEGGILYHHGLPDGQGHSDASIAFSLVLGEGDQGEERARALRAHVEKHYCNTSPKPIQFLRELQDGKKTMETEAGKTLCHNAADNEVLIEGGRAVVVAKLVRARDDEGDKNSPNPSQKEPKCTSGQSEENVKVAQEANTYKTKSDTKPRDNEYEPGFAETVGRWLRLLYDVSRGFRGASTHTGMGAGPATSPEPPLTWGSWFSSWFTTPSK